MNRITAARWAVSVALLTACGNAPPAREPAPSPALDAGTAIAITDAGAADVIVDATPPLPPAPAITDEPPPGYAKEAHVALTSNGEPLHASIAFESDSCVRVVWTAGAPVRASFGPAREEIGTRGAFGERGPVCERAGKKLDLMFSGRAEIVYEVWRLPSR